MTPAELRPQVEGFLYEEASLLDSRRWKEWLELYLPGCRFWMPAWQADHQLVQDPDSGLSFIYYDSRSGLEDRVSRALSGRSVASVPIARTCHQITNVMIESADAQKIASRCAWSCHVFDLKTQRQHTYFGRYEHVLAPADGGFRVASKKIILLNDVIPGYLDFYHV